MYVCTNFIMCRISSCFSTRLTFRVSRIWAEDKECIPWVVDPRWNRKPCRPPARTRLRARPHRRTRQHGYCRSLFFFYFRPGAYRPAMPRHAAMCVATRRRRWTWFLITTASAVCFLWQCIEVDRRMSEAGELTRSQPSRHAKVGGTGHGGGRWHASRQEHRQTCTTLPVWLCDVCGKCVMTITSKRSLG